MSDYELVEFEDISLLDAHDLRAVLGQVPGAAVLEAFGGLSPAQRRLLMNKLSTSLASQLEDQIDARGPVTFEAAQAAQKSIVEALCRLGRGGQIAFDDPADMVA